MTAHSVAVLGAAQSRFGRFPEWMLEDMVWEAVEPALNTAGIEPRDVGAVFVGNVFGPPGVASRVTRGCGIANVPVIRVENACASGTVAAHLAVESVARGEHRYVLALGVEQQSTLFLKGPIKPENTDAEGRLGQPLPAMYALMAQHYMHKYRRTVEDLALVSVKARANGARNPNAHRQQEVTLEEVLASRPIADPLTVLQCSPVSDGAAAAVFGAATGHDNEATVAASAVVGGAAWPSDRDEGVISACVRHVRDVAFSQTDIKLEDADLIEVHDAFSVGELFSVEALGLCAPGAAPDLLRDGVFHPDGRWPVNVGGGLLSRGHALGATGLAQIAEVFSQLTGTAGSRQLSAPHVGVVETMGGGASGLDGNIGVVIVLRSN